MASAATFEYSNYGVTHEQNIQIWSPNEIYGGAGQIVLIGTGASAGHNIIAWCLDVCTYLDGNG